MSQVIKIKRGGISGISGASTVKGELIIATGSLGNNASGPFLLAHGDNLGLVAGAVFTGSSVPTITDSELNGILFYDDTNNKFIRLDSAGNQSLDIAATGFTGDTDDVAEGSTNLYYTDARVKTKLTAEAVVSGSGNVLNATNVKANLPSGTVSGSAQISGITNTQLAGSIANNKLANDGITIAGVDTSLGGTITADTIAGQISNTTITNAQLVNDGITIAGADTSLGGTITAATILGAGTTANLPENTNLYYTDARVKTKLTAEAVVSGSATNVRTFLNVADGATNYGDTEVKTKLTAEAVVSGSGNVLNATNVAAAGALMDSELQSIADVKALNQSVISGATPTFTTTNFTDASNKRLLTDAQEAKIDALDQALATTSNVTFASASLANLTVTGNASIQGTLTTVNSNDVNIGDRIITLNTADGAGDAGIHVHDTNGAQTASIVWDTDGDYWKVGVVGSTQYRLVEWDGEVAGGGDFLVTNADGRIDALNTTTAGDLLQSDGDGTFTISNTIDGGSY
tara:strand:- start:263 stop:1819 length:1557 start_codon:yes stop_codon:yes gene_type:complete